MNTIFSIKKLSRAMMVCIAAMILGSCDDFVDVIPKGNTIPTTVEDLARMMNNGSVAEGNDGSFESDAISKGVMFYELLCDDYVLTDNPEDAVYYAYRSLPFVNNMMKWDEYIFGKAESDFAWDGLYHSNYIANYVLSRVDDAEESPSIKREEVKGRALVYRAMNYFLLANLYGKQYVKGEANDGLAVPLLTEPTVTESYPRATVADVYAQVMNDLNEAITLLKTGVSDFNNIPSRATAFALRARVNLWMQNYDEAYADASAALNLKNTLIDYNTLQVMIPGMPMAGLIGYDTNIETNPEILYERFVSEHPMCMYSPKMQAIIDTDNDLRYRNFISAMPAYGMFGEYCWNKLRHSGIDVSEVYLTKAEAAVRKSSADVNSALETLNALRRNRYDAATYSDCNITDPKELLGEILKERRRELQFSELAFLNKKRLTADPSTAEPMEREYDGVKYTVPLGGARWQVPIPLNVMDLNPKMVQNER